MDLHRYATTCFFETFILLVVMLYFSVKFVKHIPHAKHIHYAKGTVVKTVTRAHCACLFPPQVSAVVGTNISLIIVIVVSLQNGQNACVTVAITVACLTKIAIFKMLYVANVGKCYAITVFANDICNVVAGLAFRLPEQSVRQL